MPDELGSGAYQYALYGGNSGGDSPGRIRNNNYKAQRKTNLTTCLISEFHPVFLIFSF